MTVELESSLPGSSYLSPHVWEEERERIFFRDWYCIAREEEAPSAGDYLVREIAGESVLIVRTRTGALRAYYNVCRHRGCRLVLPGEDPESSSEGRFTNSIRCPYHSWTYGFEGDLRGAPFLRELDASTKKQLSLHPIGLDTWAGFVFVNLTPAEADAAGRGLHGQLDAVPENLRRYPLRDLRVAATIVYDVAANWKVVMENYNECYHCSGVHPELCRLVPAFKEAGGAELDWGNGIPHRDGAHTFTASGTSDRQPFPGLSDREKTHHKAEIIYPNLMLSLSSDHVAAFTLWPQGPSETRIVCSFLFDEQEIAKESFDGSDAVEFWDLVNRQDWRVCEGVQLGMSSRVFHSGYFAPMEDTSLDIRRYVGERMGRPVL